MAGVSTSTVSHVLNRTKHVSPELEERILAAMAMLDYRKPHYIASSLRSRQTGHIGVVLNNLSSEQSILTLKGISDALDAQGLTLMLRTSKGDAAQEGRHVRDLIGQQVDGLIVSSVGVAGEELVRAMDRRHPVVLIDNAPPNWDHHHANGSLVLYDIDEASYRVTHHLLSLGHRRIGLMGSTMASLRDQEFRQGYCQALDDAGITPDPTLIQTGSPDYQGGLDALARLLALNPRPSALFLTEAEMLAGVLNGLFATGLGCPADLSIVAFGHIDWAGAINPPLTTLRGDSYNLGYRAAQELRLLREGRDGNGCRVVRVATELIPRSSARTIEADPSPEKNW